MRFVHRLMAVLLILMLVGGQYGSLRAQNPATALVLALPKGLGTIINDALLKDFETANPNVQVKFVDSTPVPNVAGGLTAHFDAEQKSANSADVLFVTDTDLSPEATQAGYFLDLAPLVNSDRTINTDDFYPPIWSSFQWNKGIWALPFAAQVQVINYDPVAFDKAGIAYPDAKWTLADFTSAVDKLTIKDANGNVVTPGFATGDRIKFALFQSFIGDNLFDTSATPNLPQFDKPGVPELLTAWHKLDQAGAIGNNQDLSPLSIRQPTATANGLPRSNVLFPGGKAGLDTYGFAVSAGTHSPELAYALASFLTRRSDAVAPFNLIPSRQSIAAQGGQANQPPEIKAITDQALTNSINVADRRFVDYLDVALAKMTSPSSDPKAALLLAEQQATANLQTATAQKSKLALAVVPPAAAPLLPAGKIALKFAVLSAFDSSLNMTTLSKLIQDFTASDPQVGQITLLTDNNNTFDKASTTSDCFVMPYNAVPTANLSEVINLDPTLAADASFDKADMVGNVLSAVQRDNKIWAIPLQIEPMILQYDADQFKQAGLTPPTNNWTVQTFIDALKTLKAGPKNTAAFVARGSFVSGADGTDLMLLIADYGGIPMDYRTVPTTINFTNPATVTAIRQVLDLARNGYMTYNPLAQSPDPSTRFGTPDLTAAIYPDGLTNFTLQQAAKPSSTHKPILYPKGTTYTGFGYTLDTAYISAQSAAPDACYRWIMAITQHPEVLTAMPTRQSAIKAMQGVANPDLLALYTQIDGLLKDPTTVPFQTLNPVSISLNDLLTQYWLYQAFDSYVINNGDLDSALKDAEGYAKSFQACTANLPILSLSSINDVNAIKPLVACAEKADARLKPILDTLLR